MITTLDPSTMTTEDRDAEVIAVIAMAVTRAHRASLGAACGKSLDPHVSTPGRVEVPQPPAITLSDRPVGKRVT
ncbi:MAG: hypothetical protein U0640_11730 [Phycisphaerales bacterium]